MIGIDDGDQFPVDAEESRDGRTGIGRRGGEEDDDGVGAVVSRDAEHPADDERDLGPRHAAVGVELVDDDRRQAGPHPRPSGVPCHE